MQFPDTLPTPLNSIRDAIRYCSSQMNLHQVYFGHGTTDSFAEACSLVLQAVQQDPCCHYSLFEFLLDAQLTEDESSLIMTWLSQRINQRCPLPYITQTAWFAGHAFFVDQRVLIPRSPFAELIHRQFDSFLSTSPSAILDLCCGGGCIGIAAAQAFDDATVHLIDIDSDALDVAQINIDAYGLDERVMTIQSDVLSTILQHSSLCPETGYDLILANPPYVDAQDMQDLPSEYHHEPSTALASGADGLDLTRQILQQAQDVLAEQGWLFIEVGNSMLAFEQYFDGLDYEWCELKQGGHGILAVDKNALNEFFSN